ncbi:MAG: hypothetical protein AAF627_03060 [Myxococcota bacterium]
MKERSLQALMAESDADAERFRVENPDLHELSLFMDGELSEERHEAFIQKLMASETLQASMEAYLAMDLAAAAAGPEEVGQVVEELEKQAHAPPAPIIPLFRSLISLAAAASVLIAFGTIQKSTGPIEVAVQPVGERVRSAMVLTGDSVRIAAPAWPWASRAIRIYASESKLVFACPGEASCSPSLFEAGAQWTPEKPGSYRVVFLQGHFKDIPPSTGELLDDVELWEGLDDKTEVIRVAARP